MSPFDLTTAETIHAVFEEQARRNPERIALSYGEPGI
jgi:hypothetical protein